MNRHVDAKVKRGSAPCKHEHSRGGVKGFFFCLIRSFFSKTEHISFKGYGVNMAWLIFCDHTKFGIQIFKYNQNISRVGEFFITKAQKYENTKKIIIKFRAFPISCFRDCFYFLPKKAQNSQIRYSNIWALEEFLSKSFSISGMDDLFLKRVLFEWLRDR